MIGSTISDHPPRGGKLPVGGVIRFRRLVGWQTVALLLGTGTVARAGLIFQDSGDSTGGATRTLPATSSIQSGNIFTNDSGNYVNSTLAAGAGTSTVATFNPAAAENSWAAWLGIPINVGGISYLNLNGAFEVFVRPNAMEPGAAWFRPVDVVYGGLLRIIFNGSSSGNLQMEVVTSTTALGSSPGSFTAANTWVLPGAITSVPSLLTSGAVTHYGITFKTDPASGQITMKVFGTPGAGEIGTSSDTAGMGNLLAKQSFYANADAIGSNPLPHGSWSMTARPANGSSFATAISVDYDSVRLYNSVPGTFPAAGAPPGSIPVANWSTYSARRDWLLALGWPGPNPGSKLGMSYNLATFYNYPAGSAQSRLAVTNTVNMLGAQLDTYEELCSSEFFPLGVVRAIYQYGDRFTPAQLSQIGGDAQRMYYWYGGGTENHHLMRIANGYLLAQKFPTNANVWSSHGTGSAKVNSATLRANSKEALCLEGQLRYQSSFAESVSPNYLLTHLIPLQHLYEFADDPEVRSMAAAMLTHCLAQLAVNVYEGYVLDPYPRFYNSCFINGGVGPGAEDAMKNNTMLLNWLYWGQGVPDVTRFTSWGDNLFLVYPALSAYQPRPALERIANWSSANSNQAHWVKTSVPRWPSSEGSMHNTRLADIERKRIWRDREFAVGSMVGYHVLSGFYWQDGSKLGVTWRSSDRLQYLQAGHPYWLADEPEAATNFAWWQAPQSPFMQVAHHKNTAVVMFNIPTADPWPNSAPARPDFYYTDRTLNPPRIRRSEHAGALRQECGLRFPVTMDESSEATNADGTKWYFLREGQAYIGIRTLSAATAVTDGTVFWRAIYATPGLHGGRTQTGFIIEIGTSAASGGQFASFAAFKSALTPRQFAVTWGSGTTPSLSVEYTNTQNVALRTEYDTNMVSDTEGKVRMFPNVWINGTPDRSDPWPELDARLDDTHPLVTMVNSVLTITDPATGGLVEQVDWSGSLPVITMVPPLFLPPVVGNGQITLKWSGGGQLQWAPAVQGPWTAITPAPASPYSEALMPGMNRFYRVQGQ